MVGFFKIVNIFSDFEKKTLFIYPLIFIYQSCFRKISLILNIKDDFFVTKT